MKDRPSFREWTARFFIAIVLAMNLICAVDFILRPDLYVGSNELAGEVGRAAIIGFGILFLMWQVPYFFALYHPKKYKTSLLQAILMQTIGLIGEVWLLSTLSAERVILRRSITRFVIFDGGGLVLLLLAAILTGFHFRSSEKEEQ
ncbi:MAG: hypothetical protein PHT43_08165 [Anaerolineaceae bacterium]|nr:hypothetical protein [Anaerolineaceae bacterium]